MNSIKKPQITILILILTFLSVYFADSYPVLELAKFLLGSLVVLFLPGYWLVECSFRSGKMDIIERLALSFALSVSLLSLSAYGISLAGLPISAISVLAIIASIIGLSFIYLYKLKPSK